MQLNERSWAGHVISWIKERIANNQTIFEDATNDPGLKTEGGRTKFPDVILYLNKISGIVFNGWELKFPDTSASDQEMLLNALEKAKSLQSNSFVTWNGSEAIIWGIGDANYDLNSLKILKKYPPDPEISSRNDLANWDNYQRHEPKLKATLNSILNDLRQLHQDGTIKEALNISTNVVSAISDVSTHLIPLLTDAVRSKAGDDADFRRDFNRWKILESSTLKILGSTSRRVVQVDPMQVLGKFTYYKLIGKILFYLTLSENLSARIPRLKLDAAQAVKQQLEAYFEAVKAIDYQAVFEDDFTDVLDFSAQIDQLILNLVSVFNRFDFSILPTEVVGNILENLVPREEKLQFGQYFTSETLAKLVSVSAIKTRNDVLFDPTSGTGSFLTAFYSILKHYGQSNHQRLLTQVWGNDISHFPAILSVINLYKQDVTDVNNFPRVTRRNFFDLQPGQLLPYPDPVQQGQFTQIALPTVNAIISNFPFIQFEDHPDIGDLVEQFRNEFGTSQAAFLDGSTFYINERSDYFVYCFYHSLKFLQPNGYLAAITSNAWLGKNYGTQFKQFLLDNFSIRYVVRSNAEHWFSNSKVSTIFTTVQKIVDDRPTRFITLNFKLDDYFNEDNADRHIGLMEEIFSEVDNCDIAGNPNWTKDAEFPNVYTKNDGSIRVSLVQRTYLETQISNEENWSINFLAENPLQSFEEVLINPFPQHYTSGRGTKTWKDAFFILSQQQADDLEIEDEFLQPALERSGDITNIHFDETPSSYFFICEESLPRLRQNYPNAYRWIMQWSNTPNKKGVPLSTALQTRTREWYTLKPEDPANIFISINPNERIFFSFSEEKIYVNQRLVAIRVQDESVWLYAALLNSVVSLLVVEFNGVSRNLGALDLNADMFKSKMKILNPDLLSDEGKQRIIDAFRPVASRPVLPFREEFVRDDRRHFDEVILTEFGFDTAFVPKLYTILIQIITDRIEMKDR